MEQLPAIITKARARLLVRAPFIGSIALGRAWVNAPEIGTMATDGRSIWFNPAWCEAHGVEKTMGVIAHEVFHVVNRHHLRRGERDAKLWNIAGDLLINRLLEDDKTNTYCHPTASLIVTVVTPDCRPRPSTRVCSNSSSNRMNSRGDHRQAKRAPAMEVCPAMAPIRPRQVRQGATPRRIRETLTRQSACSRHATGARSATCPSPTDNASTPRNGVMQSTISMSGYARPQRLQNGRGSSAPCYRRWSRSRLTAWTGATSSA